MLEIWGRKYSSHVIPVMWTAGETGVEHAMRVCGGSFGGLDTPEYARMNPNREIPTINDNGFVLWESHAIVRYLCAKYSMGTFCPASLTERAIAEQWMEWCKSLAFPNVFPLFWMTVRTAPGNRDPAKIEEQAIKAGKVLKILDDRLGEVPYVAGASFTMGDIPLGAVAYRYYNVNVSRPSLPNIEKWYAKLCERPAFQKHVMNFFGTTPEEWQELERQSGKP